MATNHPNGPEDPPGQHLQAQNTNAPRRDWLRQTAQSSWFALITLVTGIAFFWFSHRTYDCLDIIWSLVFIFCTAILLLALFLLGKQLIAFKAENVRLKDEKQRMQTEINMGKEEMDIAEASLKKAIFLLEKHKADNQNMLDRALISIFGNLGLSGHERITLFVREESGWYLAIGRYTSNTLFTTIRNPANGTVFGPLLETVFSSGSDHILLEINHDARKHWKEYLKKLNAYCNCPDGRKFKRQDLEKMRMQPKSIYLSNVLHEGNRKGIIMVESQNINALDKDKIKMVFDIERHLIVGHIQQYLTAKSTTANQKGF